jgi:hypothetical protein
MFRHKKFRLAAVAVCIIVCISGFTYAAQPLFQWLADQPLQTITLDHATTIQHQVTDHGITLHLDQAYADGARTAVTFHVTAHSSLQPVPLAPAMTDTAHQTYSLVDGRQVKSEALAEFLPLALSQAGKNQLLTFTVRQMHLSGYNTAGQPVTGNWSISFRITPQADQFLTPAAAPATHSGITVQPILLDLAASGMRLVVRISGLTPNTSLATLTRFATRQAYSAPSPDGGNTGTTGTNSDGALLQVHQAAGQVLLPVWAGIQPDGDMRQPDHAVGITGTVTLEVLFFTTLQSTQGPLTLTIDHLHLAQSGNSAQLTAANGPWTFAIPLK